MTGHVVVNLDGNKIHIHWKPGFQMIINLGWYYSKSPPSDQIKTELKGALPKAESDDCLINIGQIFSSQIFTFIQHFRYRTYNSAAPICQYKQEQIAYSPTVHLWLWHTELIDEQFLCALSSVPPWLISCLHLFNADDLVS